MTYLEKLCSSLWLWLKDFLLTLPVWGRAFVQSIGRLTYSILANFFPLYAGAFFLFFYQDDFKLRELLTTQNLSIYSATFVVSSLYLWYQTTEKRRSYSGLTMHLILLIAVVIVFILSYLSPVAKENLLYPATCLVFLCAILLYIYYEVCFVYIGLNVNGTAALKEEEKKRLDDDFDKLTD